MWGQISRDLVGGAKTLAQQIAALFKNDEEGAWYDPSDLTTLFQDQAGTVPVTGAEQPVRLMLDKRKGLTLGPELVANGDFSAGTTGWLSASGGIASVSNGELTVTQPVGDSIGAIYQTISNSLTVGKTYQVTVTVVDYTEESPRLGVTTSPSGVFNVLALISDPGGGGVYPSAPGTFSAVFQYAGESPLFFSVANLGDGSFTTVSNVSVRELSGNHAIAPSAAARPALGRTVEGGRRNLLLNTDTLATQNATVTNVEHTLSFYGTGTVTLSGTSTAGPLVGTGATDRVTLAFTPTAGTLTLTVAGSVTEAQLEVGSTPTDYQRVGASALDVTEAGKPELWYLQFDGVDDFFRASGIAASGEHWAVVAGSGFGQTHIFDISNAGSGQPRHILRLNQDWFFRIAGGTSTTFPVTVDETVCVYTSSMREADRSVRGRVNGGAFAELILGGTGWMGDEYTIDVYREAAGVNKTTGGNFYGIIVIQKTGLDPSNIEAYLAQKSGVILP